MAVNTSVVGPGYWVGDDQGTSAQVQGSRYPSGTISVFTGDGVRFDLVDASTGQILRRINNQAAALSAASAMVSSGYRTPT